MVNSRIHTRLRLSCALTRGDAGSPVATATAERTPWARPQSNSKWLSTSESSRGLPRTRRGWTGANVTLGQVASQPADEMESFSRVRHGRPKGKRSERRRQGSKRKSSVAGLQRRARPRSGSPKSIEERFTRRTIGRFVPVGAGVSDWRGSDRHGHENLQAISSRFRNWKGPAAALLCRSEPIRCHVRARIQRNGSSPAAAQGGAGSGSRSVSLPRMRTCQDAGRIRRTAATARSRMGGAGKRVEIHRKGMGREERLRDQVSRKRPECESRMSCGWQPRVDGEADKRQLLRRVPFYYQRASEDHQVRTT